MTPFHNMSTAFELVEELFPTVLNSARILRYFLVPVSCLKHKTIHSRTTHNKNVQMFGDLANSYAVIVVCTFFKRSWRFLMRTHAYNACRQILHWCNDAYCWKSVRRMTIQASELLLFIELSSTFCFLNASFPHPHPYTKSFFLSFFAFTLRHIILKHSLYIKDIHELSWNDLTSCKLLLFYFFVFL